MDRLLGMDNLYILVSKKRFALIFDARGILSHQQNTQKSVVHTSVFVEA